MMILFMEFELVKVFVCLYLVQEFMFSFIIIWFFGIFEQQFNGSCVNNVLCVFIVNCCVDWYGVFYIVNNEELVVVGLSVYDFYIFLVIDFEMCFFLFFYN